jgi:hypothetical protein
VRTAIARNGGAVPGEDRKALAEYFDAHMAMTSAEAAAQRIVAGITGNRARVVIGADAHVLHGLVRAGGSVYQRLVAFGARRTPSSVRSAVSGR